MARPGAFLCTHSSRAMGNAEFTPPCPKCEIYIKKKKKQNPEAVGRAVRSNRLVFGWFGRAMKDISGEGWIYEQREIWTPESEPCDSKKVLKFGVFFPTAVGFPSELPRELEGGSKKLQKDGGAGERIKIFI